jgi:hypothetical protein
MPSCGEASSFFAFPPQLVLPARDGCANGDELPREDCCGHKFQIVTGIGKGRILSKTKSALDSFYYYIFNDRTCRKICPWRYAITL